jgi:hypothetical protein
MFVLTIIADYIFLDVDAFAFMFVFYASIFFPVSILKNQIMCQIGNLLRDIDYRLYYKISKEPARIRFVKCRWIDISELQKMIAFKEIQSVELECLVKDYKKSIVATVASFVMFIPWNICSWFLLQF